MPLDSDPILAIASATAAFWGVAATIGAASAWHRVRGTTLAAPAAWGVVAAASFAVVEATLAWRSDLDATLGASLARYAAAVGSCCPLMAVLGAKRPQDRGWQWVVLSLWIILLVPAGQAWAARSGGQLEVSAPWRIMLGGLVAICLLNYLPTRNAVPALLFAGGQATFFAAYAIRASLTTASDRLIAAVAIVLAMGLARLTQRRATKPAAVGRGELARFNDRWLEFRDGWGAFWGLRIMNRVNETAELSDWPVRLQWSGFALHGGASEDGIDERVRVQIEQAMNSLLRRFERVEGDAD